MEFQKIFSGKGVPQILHLGYRLKHNTRRKGQRKGEINYFDCVNRDCYATLGTLGDADGDLTLSFHKHDQHNHAPNVAANIVAATLSEFRETLRLNPNLQNRQLFEEIRSKAIDSVDESFRKDLETKMPAFNTISKQGQRICAKGRIHV